MKCPDFAVGLARAFKISGTKHVLMGVALAVTLAVPRQMLIAEEPDPVQQDEVTLPSGVKYQFIGSYSIDRLNHILTAELKEFSSFPMSYPPARYAVKLYRITYPSVVPEHNNRPTVASGLLVVPENGADTMPVISYQHGTVFSKTEVPSHPDESMETRLMIAQFAGQGYMMIAADYFGAGVSTEPDSYLVKASTQQACLDMMLAAQAVSTDLKLHWGPLFLSGWSQGGWGTMVFLNKLESLDIPVKAAAVASAPVDLFAIMNRWLHAPEDHDAVYLPALGALQINAYEEYYGLAGLESVLKPQYRSVARDLFVKKLPWTEVLPKLPTRMKDFFQDDFIAASSLGSTPYWTILRDDQAYRWRSKTPLHTYYGDEDEVVPAYIATLPVSYQKSMGGADTVGIEVFGNADHRGTFLYAVGDQKKWFDQLLSLEAARK